MPNREEIHQHLLKVVLATVTSAAVQTSASVDLLGFDSCSSGAVSKLLPEYEEYIEPCESGLFSLYVNVKGEAFPCSFLEGVEAPLDLKVLSFEDVWNSDPLSLFRRRLLQNGRGCPLTP